MTKRGLRHSLSAWANTSHQDARDLREEYADSNFSMIGDAPDRESVRLRGTLRTVTLRPRAGLPVLEAELFDGTGVITVVWLGRRRIGGITAGRSLQVQGRLSSRDDLRLMYNPRYELMS